MREAAKAYSAEREKPKKQRKGLRKICEMISMQHKQKTGEWVQLSHVTLSRSAGNSHIPLSTFNESKGWLNPTEAEAVVQYCEELANRGFPLSHRRLQDIVDNFIKVREGPSSNFVGVGKNWTNHFLEKHADRLSTYWSKSLDSKRGKAVNPTTNTLYLDSLEAALDEDGEPIPPHRIFQVDEIGFLYGVGEKERVIGSKGKKVQHQQRSGTRETITVIPTICADGTSIPPAVIFKGEAFQVKWRQDNPLNASYVLFPSTKAF